MEPAPKDGVESRPPAGAGVSPPAAPAAPAFGGGEPRYAGFWIRVVAHLVDATLLAFIVTPLLLFVYGPEVYIAAVVREAAAGRPSLLGPADFLITWVLPSIAVLLFWFSRAATPGKMAVSVRIVDAKTGGKPSLRQFVVRYIGYFPASLVLGLGLLWVAFDPRKQGWHDKMAGTLAVRE